VVHHLVDHLAAHLARHFDPAGIKGERLTDDDVEIGASQSAQVIPALLGNTGAPLCNANSTTPGWAFCKRPCPLRVPSGAMTRI
jgi:hypothetical protein